VSGTFGLFCSALFCVLFESAKVPVDSPAVPAVVHFEWNGWLLRVCVSFVHPAIVEGRLVRYCMLIV
jgi:starvation-inducible outer membrane lipoprotein